VCEGEAGALGLVANRMEGDAMTSETNPSARGDRMGTIVKVNARVSIGVGLVLVMKYFNLHQVFHDALAWIDLSLRKKYAPR
jgi:hypothetical protein